MSHSKSLLCLPDRRRSDILRKVATLAFEIFYCNAVITRKLNKTPHCFKINCLHKIFHFKKNSLQRNISGVIFYPFKFYMYTNN